MEGSVEQNSASFNTYTIKKDLERGRYARLAQVPILRWVVVIQHSHQSWNVHVVIVVEVTPPSVRGKKDTKGGINNDFIYWK